MYKLFNPDDIQFVQQDVSATVTLDSTQGSSGVTATAYLSSSSNTDSQSYYRVLNQLFYKKHNHGGNSSHTGKGVYYSYTEDRFSNPQYKNKFYSGSQGVLFTISSSKYGRSIKPGTFQLTDTSTGSIKIVDDGYGNLYPTNATISQSGNSSISSSDNYVGNIFYEHGLAVITETGSHSTGCHYTSSGKTYSLEFKNMKRIDTLRYRCKLEPNEYNTTMNRTVLSASSPVSESSFNDSRQFGIYSYIGDGGLDGKPAYYQSGSIVNVTDGTIKPVYRTNDFRTYISSIGFYNNNNELIMVAKFPQPIKKLMEQAMTIFVEMDF